MSHSASSLGHQARRAADLVIPPRVSEPLASPSDWSFELIDQYHAQIRATAQRFGLDTYPNQLEIITAEQMMDAYASVGMPVNYRHWSYGKEFISTEKKYRRGHMGLAYEIVINSNPCISYLMEENTMAMQALVIAHAAYGHNSPLKEIIYLKCGRMPHPSLIIWFMPKIMWLIVKCAMAWMQLKKYSTVVTP
jgi:stage V sporulation protein R